MSSVDVVEPLIVLPGPWPGHPHPFKRVRVYYEKPQGLTQLTCRDCPKNMLCLAGERLFAAEELQGRPTQRSTRYTICAQCSALLWYGPGDATLHICYALGKGLWCRLGWDRMTDFGKEPLSRILMAVIGKSDPDLVTRFFRKDNLCGHYRGIVGDCGRLYKRFLQQRSYLPTEWG